MKYYVEQEGLSFGMASPETYRKALQAAGFEDIRLANRNAWYREQAKRELALLEGELYDRAAAAADRGGAVHEAPASICSRGSASLPRPTSCFASRACYIPTGRATHRCRSAIAYHGPRT